MLAKNYQNINDAAKGLLLESVEIASKAKTDFVVIGGWCSFLRNSNDQIKHPGTRDVDLLFFDGDVIGSLKNVILEFLKHGYLFSAKHDFQLFKKYNIAGKELVFNVDLLHPLETEVKGDLFADHFDLGIYFDDDEEELKKIKSIALPSSKFILSDKLFSKFTIGNSTIPLLDQAGLIFSKCKSVKSEKRQRDSFDIYLALNQPDTHMTIQGLRQCCSKNSVLKKSITDLMEFIKQNSEPTPISRTEECVI